jgi:hypothetical protein
MISGFDDFPKFGKDGLDAAMNFFNTLSKNGQAISVEMVDYTKRAFEDATATTEKLVGAKSLEKAFEVQTDYVKRAYEGFVAESTKLGELYADLAQQAYKSFDLSGKATR